MGRQSQHEWGLNPTGMGHWPRPQVEMCTEGLGASKTGGVSLLKITWAWTRNRRDENGRARDPSPNVLVCVRPPIRPSFPEHD